MRVNEWDNEDNEDDVDEWDTYTEDDLAFLGLSIILGSIMLLIGIIARTF